MIVNRGSRFRLGQVRERIGGTDHDIVVVTDPLLLLPRTRSLLLLFATEPLFRLSRDPLICFRLLSGGGGSSGSSAPRLLLLSCCYCRRPLGISSSFGGGGGGCTQTLGRLGLLDHLDAGGDERHQLKYVLVPVRAPARLRVLRVL